LFCAAFASPSDVSSQVDLGHIITGGLGAINSPHGAEGFQRYKIEPETSGMEGKVCAVVGALGADEHLPLRRQARVLPPAIMQEEVAELVAF
jgi:hypothetical protein